MGGPSITRQPMIGWWWREGPPTVRTDPWLEKALHFEMANVESSIVAPRSTLQSGEAD